MTDQSELERLKAEMDAARLCAAVRGNIDAKLTLTAFHREIHFAFRRSETFRP